MIVGVEKNNCCRNFVWAFRTICEDFLVIWVDLFEFIVKGLIYFWGGICFPPSNSQLYSAKICNSALPPQTAVNHWHSTGALGVFHPSLTNNGSWLHLGGTVAKPLFSPLMPPLWTPIYHSSSRGFSAWLYYAYQQSDVSTIGDILGHRHLSLNGHVARLDPGVPAHDALHLMVDNLWRQKAKWSAGEDCQAALAVSGVWLNKVQQDANALPLSMLWRFQIARGHAAERCNSPFRLWDDEYMLCTSSTTVKTNSSRMLWYRDNYDSDFGYDSMANPDAGFTVLMVAVPWGELWSTE